MCIIIFTIPYLLRMKILLLQNNKVSKEYTGWALTKNIFKFKEIFIGSS